MRKRIFARRGVTIVTALVLATSALGSVGALADDLPVQPTVERTVEFTIPGAQSFTYTFSYNGNVQTVVTPVLSQAKVIVDTAWTTATTMPIVKALQCSGGGGIQVIIDNIRNGGEVTTTLLGKIGSATASSTTANQSQTVGEKDYSLSRTTGRVDAPATDVQDLVMTLCAT